MVDKHTTKDTPDNVVALPTHKFTDEQALNWIRERGCVTAPASHLARVWGWHERSTRRRLERWNRARLIRRKGKLITVVTLKSDTPIPAKRTANGQTQTEKTDTGRRISDTNKDSRSDAPRLADWTVHAKAASEVKLLEPAPDVTSLMQAPPN